MEIVSREGSLVQVRDKSGKLWLTRRKKRRHDSRRRKGWYLRGKSVIYIPIKRIVEKDDWLFTCSLKPLQFSHTLFKDKELKGYDKNYWDNVSKEEREAFIEDDFVTLEGSHHSRKHCSLTPISDEYAKFFNDHKLWELFEINYKDFEKYEQAVKDVCKAFNVKFEGI